ncbi:DUF2442 domain-containing protein [Bradyrhizobium sp. JYMT SZCCT0180]|uniref:DUF2442 domain-containing protein n=1 Tax=Bradyrhizobium sp. JYMT SZCCT0180 TaxID=2807666 RepID=UPI001BACE544|nr:DUF2442 domain-containing protein [Bradyrhizobium sp. JYMT SZCCT0180]MBR1214551.1 DUF2442 domain-containing protein [Bradyrhizobium sp. JYMT SZCCT0180]
MEVHQTNDKGEAGFPLIVSAEPVMFGVLHVVFDDGYEGVLDLRSVMDRAIWQNIRTKEDFFKIELDRIGGQLFWPKGDGATELPADGIRAACEHQEKLLRSIRW